MKYLPNLTGLRFLLASIVIFFHVPQFCENRKFPFFKDLPIFNRGTEAVYLFFSLSGFLIIRMLYVKKHKKGINFWNFYRNRILRIFPLYYLILVFGFVYYRVILPKMGFEIENNYSILKGVMLGATFFANILQTYSPGGILEILWSLAIEEQFYIIIAPVLYYVPVKKVKPFLLLFTAISFGLLFFQSALPISEWMMYFYYFSFSGLISILCFENKTLFSNAILKAIIYVLIGIYFFTSYLQLNFLDYQYHLITMVLFSLFLACLSVKPNIVLENKTMRYLGSISYGVYMFHAIAINFVGFVFLKIVPSTIFSYNIFIVIFFVLVFSITIMASHYSFKYYESYFLKKKNSSRA